MNRPRCGLCDRRVRYRTVAHTRTIMCIDGETTLTVCAQCWHRFTLAERRWFERPARPARDTVEQLTAERDEARRCAEERRDAELRAGDRVTGYTERQFYIDRKFPWEHH